MDSLMSRILKRTADLPKREKLEETETEEMIKGGTGEIEIEIGKIGREKLIWKKIV